jgi:hypothetical protein
LPWDALHSEQSAVSHTPPQIGISDERDNEGSAGAWIDSIGHALERHQRDRVPFAVMLVELADVERLGHDELPPELPRLTIQLEDALAQALQTAGGTLAASLTLECPGRYWLLVPETDRLRAQALAERLVRTIGQVGAAASRDDVTERYYAALATRMSPRRASRQGAPLELTVGAAICPDDGEEAAALAARADLELKAARAAGRPIVSVSDRA